MIATTNCWIEKQGSKHSKIAAYCTEDNIL